MRLKQVMLVGVALMLLATACSGDDTAASTSSTTAPTTTTTQVTTTTLTTSSTAITTSTVATTTSTATTTTAVATTTTTEGPTVPLSNGDFETGDLTGWSTENRQDGEWLVYEDGTIPPKPSITDQEYPFRVPAPPQGRYAAVTDMDQPGVRFLYRDIEVNGPYLLHVTVFYVNSWGGFRDPSHFLLDDSNQVLQNQQYRLDLLDPAAPVDSLEPDDILATVFRTKPGDPLSLEPTALTFDLSPWEGQTIRLRAAEIDTQAPIRAGIDDVRLEMLTSA